MKMLWNWGEEANERSARWRLRQPVRTMFGKATGMLGGRETAMAEADSTQDLVDLGRVPGLQHRLLGAVLEAGLVHRSARPMAP